MNRLKNVKKILICTIVSAVVMFGFPAFAELVGRITKGYSGFIIDMGWIYVINPLFMVFIGIFTGGQFKKIWFVPMFPTVLFCASAFLFNVFRDLAFIPYACGYLAVGEIAGLLTSLVKKSKANTKGKDNG